MPFLPLTGSTDVAGELVILVAAAVVGGFAASLLRTPLIVGYIAGGLIVGPSAAGLVGDISDVTFIGELGIALLLFTIGLEFPLRQFRRLGGRLYAAAVIQIGVLGAGGFALGQTFGLSDAAATLVAGAVAFSSTALLVRILAQGRERGRVDRQWALGIALAQDLVAVPLLVVLPQLGEGSGGEVIEDTLVALGKGVGLVAAVLIGGRFLVPWILRQALAARSRELFLMATFALASGVALGGFAVGLSLAFGAFLAGLATAQSPYATRALHELVPLRDLFAATFFVSIGVLLDLSVVGDEWQLFTTLLLWGALGKVLLIFALARWAHFDASRALRVGLILGQVGEFSFLLAETASQGPAEEAGGVIIAVGAVSMAVSAGMIGLNDAIERGLLTIPFVRARWTFEPQVGQSGEALQRHTVIAGYGEVGHELARVLKRRGFRYLVVDFDPNFPDDLAGGDTPYIWGDLANPSTLEDASLETALVLAIAVPDVVVTESVVRRARQEHPRLHIVARADGAERQARVLAAGADVVVDPMQEVGLELAHATLHRYGVTLTEIRQAMVQRRQRHIE